jgi:hypothetical protein
MGVRGRFFGNSSIREDPMTYAIVNKPELAVVSMSDNRTDSKHFLDFAKEAGIDENDPSLLRLLKTLETRSNGKMASWNDDGISGDRVYTVRTGGCVQGIR